MTPRAITATRAQKPDPFLLAADLLDPPPNPYLDDPVGWVGERLGDHLWSKQVEVAQSVAEHRLTAVRSSHAVGKSYTAGRLAAWWLDTHPPGDAFVVTTAPSGAQVRAILWKEIGRAHRKGKLAGRVNQTEWWIGDEMVGMGRKPADYDPNAFQGIHATHVLVILDEAAGVSDLLWTAAGSLTANRFSRILAIGNPEDSSSHFAKVCQPGSGWNVVHISAFDSPNFTDEAVPTYLADLLISQPYLDDLIADGCGPGTPIWRSKVEGEFTEDATSGVVPLSMLAACRIEADHEPDDLLPVELGVDVGASDEGDMTVVRERRGVKAGRVWRTQSSDPEVVVEHVWQAIVEAEPLRVKIDSIGIGWGVAGHLRDRVREAGLNCDIVSVNVATASSKPSRFPRLRDELWWEVGRMNSEQHTWDLSAIDDRTAADLMAPKWAPDARGRIQVERKADTKKRLGRSPDDADALLLAFYGTGASIQAPTGRIPIGPSGSRGGGDRFAGMPEHIRRVAESQLRRR